jgi:hypothetical protein
MNTLCGTFGCDEKSHEPCPGCKVGYCRKHICNYCLMGLYGAARKQIATEHYAARPPQVEPVEGRKRKRVAARMAVSSSSAAAAAKAKAQAQAKAAKKK